MHARNTSANITPAVAGAVVRWLCSEVGGEGGAQTETFVIHGTPKTCSAITQLDSALLTESPQFFSGWTENDYTDAVAWSQACAGYGWQVPWRPRIPLLQAQHDKALRPAQTQTVSSTAAAGAPTSPPVQAAIAAPQAAIASPQATIATPAQAVPSAATGSVPPSAPVQAPVSAPDQTEPRTAPRSASPRPDVQTLLARPPQAVPRGTPPALPQRAP